MVDLNVSTKPQPKPNTISGKMADKLDRFIFRRKLSKNHDISDSFHTSKLSEKELLEHGYNSEDEFFLRENQKATISGLEAIPNREEKHWAKSGIEGKVSWVHILY